MPFGFVVISCAPLVLMDVVAATFPIHDFKHSLITFMFLSYQYVVFFKILVLADRILFLL